MVWSDDCGFYGDTNLRVVGRGGVASSEPREREPGSAGEVWNVSSPERKDIGWASERSLHQLSGNNTQTAQETHHSLIGQENNSCGKDALVELKRSIRMTCGRNNSRWTFSLYIMTQQWDFHRVRHKPQTLAVLQLPQRWACRRTSSAHVPVCGSACTWGVEWTWAHPSHYAQTAGNTPIKYTSNVKYVY